MSSTIITAQAPDAGWIADLIGASFQHLGACHWLIPDPAARARILPRAFELHVQHALVLGEVHVAGDRSAVAIWVPREAVAPPPPHDYGRRLADVCGMWTDRFEYLDKLFEQHHPEPPHHHLAFLAVRTDAQRAGLGSALLDHHHRVLDGTGTAAFLEASSTGSRDLYLRHGYRLMGEPYAVPNGAQFWPMWRDPKS